MTPHDDLSLEDFGAAMLGIGSAALAALAFIVVLIWSLSATTPSPSLVGTGARDILPADAPVPYVEEAR